MAREVKFLGLPGIFLHHYKKDLAGWLGNYQKVGTRKELWLQAQLGGPMVIGDGSSPPMVPSIQRVTLVGTLINHGNLLVVRPLDARTEKLISKHSEELESLYDISDHQH